MSADDDDDNEDEEEAIKLTFIGVMKAPGSGLAPYDAIAHPERKQY